LNTVVDNSAIIDLKIVNSVASFVGVQTKEVPDTPEAIVLTRTWLAAGPFLSNRVTGPVAPVQVMVNGVPSVMPLKSVLVNCAA